MSLIVRGANVIVLAIVLRIHFALTNFLSYRDFEAGDVIFDRIVKQVRSMNWQRFRSGVLDSAQVSTVKMLKYKRPCSKFGLLW